MKNPYEELHREFVNAGARVLLSSGLVGLAEKHLKPL